GTALRRRRDERLARGGQAGSGQGRRGGSQQTERKNARHGHGQSSGHGAHSPPRPPTRRNTAGHTRGPYSWRDLHRGSQSGGRRKGSQATFSPAPLFALTKRRELTIPGRGLCNEGT